MSRWKFITFLPVWAKLHVLSPLTIARANCVRSVIAQRVCLAVLQKYQDDLADLPSQSGLQSTLYTGLTVALVATGASYLLQPQVCILMLFCI